MPFGDGDVVPKERQGPWMGFPFPEVAAIEEFTGIDDGEEETVIDLSVQPEMMRGLFGQMTAGAGTDVPSQAEIDPDLRYLGNAFIGRFTSNSQISLILNGNNTNNYQLSTQYMRDASYLKLKNAEIGYTIPEKISKKAKMSKLRIFINGSNLFSIDKLKIVDPEFDYGTGNYPIQRVLNIGLDIEF